VIFAILIPFVHREGGIGQQARDALLLCMSLSKKNESVGLYIAEHSNVCPVSIILFHQLFEASFQNEKRSILNSQSLLLKSMNFQ
jgi:hypothetical protein